MLDRASAFADEGIIELLRTRFVAVAYDVFYGERRNDAAGEFYRKVVYQRRGMRKGKTTQGFYIFVPWGTLICGINHRDPAFLKKRLKDALKKDHDLRAPEIEATDEGARWSRKPPDGGLVVDVFSKVLDAEWDGTDSPGATDCWKPVWRASLGRDHLWLTKQEVSRLGAGKWPAALGRRIARFHLIDNTRGEPAMWAPQQIELCEFELKPDGDGFVLVGRARARADEGKRGYDLALRGRIVARHDRVARFDVVARGEYWGGTRFSSVDLPKGRFRFAVAFRIAPDDEAAKVPPQGARSLRTYLEAR